MSWFFITFKWYIYLFILGIIFLPTAKLLFAKFYDYGYPFAKIIGVLILSFTLFILGILKILPFSRGSIFALVSIAAVLNWWLFRKKPFELDKKRLTLLIAEEVLFFIGLLLWTLVRSQEPSLRGLEKFMDFGFMNSILRTTYFPPYDMWLSGHTINYYYFGHLMGAVLIKFAGIAPAIGYNLILATIFALGITQTFSLCFSIIHNSWNSVRVALIGALLGLFIVNFGGNLHTIYSFTKGYANDKPVAPWELKNPPIGCYTANSKGEQEWSLYCPQSYWYPNATRFIPFTIHEFPMYSYVVADLHGHVFDIPLVLLTLATLYILFTSLKEEPEKQKKQFGLTMLVGFLTSVNYMTNAFDGPIYLLLTLSLIFFALRLRLQFLLHFLTLIVSFVIFSLPFSIFFKPFVSGIGINCAPITTNVVTRFGPFLVEPGNCQHSAWWMLTILWGFFWFNFIFFGLPFFKKKWLGTLDSHQQTACEFFLIIFAFGTALLVIPEFFYIKDIYPAHFRANTMFKLGYQAFIMMGIASSYTFVFYKKQIQKNIVYTTYLVCFIVLFLLTALYPYFAITSYYGRFQKTPQLDGAIWLKSQYPEYKEIIDYLNAHVGGQPTILEAQGDSYTDYNVISSYTGLPTVAGWLVHQWLWRGSSTIVSNIAPDIQTMYETPDGNVAKNLIRKYHIKYIVVGTNERTKYTNIQEKKFNAVAKKVFQSSVGNGMVFFVE